MAQSAWPKADRRNLIGKRISRLDGPQKATGTAKFAYDMMRPGMLYARALQAPHGLAKIRSIDTSEAEKMPGVKAVVVEKTRRGEFPEITHVGMIVATVAATSEEIATDALKKIKVDYEISAPQMDDRDPSQSSGREQKRDVGDADAGFAEADTVSEGHYGLAAITHCCLESHGQVLEFRDGELYVWPSTQYVSGYAGQIARPAEIEAEKVHVDCQYMGGGFGSKFSPDQWAPIAVKLAKTTGKPIKFMLERDDELKIAGARPSAFANVKVGVKKDGTITAWDSDCWGSNGMGRFRMPPLPYVFTGVPNSRTLGRSITTNRGNARAWRGPNHPQGALITMGALEDAAAAIGMDPIEFFKKNLHLTDRPDVYEEELDKAAELIDYKAKAHPRGDKTPGPIKRGLGISIHTWGGMGHPAACNVTLNPDGTVGVKIGSQDLGTGTRTIITMVVAETLGLPMEKVTLQLGSNAYPQAGASGGSTTVGGVSASSRDAATQALNALLDKVAPEMGAQPAQLEAWNGKIQQIDKPSNSIPWEKACSYMGQMAITKQGSNPTGDGTSLISGGVGGAQIADVSVDIETGVVTMNEFVAVQDCGLVIDPKTCESQVFGAMIMGITYALYEEAIYDGTTGTMLNADMEFYRLAGLGDIGNFKVHLMTGPKYEERGVIGVGEPPVISPGAAISNAVANAIGVRVSELPLTPDRVLQALSEKGVGA